MTMVEIRRLVKALIAEGINTTPKLQAEFTRRGVRAAHTVTPKAISAYSTRGDVLKQALLFLRHRRKIKFDRTTKTWQLVVGPYHPFEPMEKTLRRNSVSIPKTIDPRILLL